MKKSHPTWVRGLKQFGKVQSISAHLVAPYVGAWIETAMKEICNHSFESHPTWVRGLKRSFG